MTWAANPGVDSSGGREFKHRVIQNDDTGYQRRDVVRVDAAAPRAGASATRRVNFEARCADAGHCCLPGTLTAGATNLAGGCLRRRTTLSVTKELGRMRGARTSYVNRFSTVYIKLTASKPIDVRRVLIGGVLVPESDARWARCRRFAANRRRGARRVRRAKRRFVRRERPTSPPSSRRFRKRRIRGTGIRTRSRFRIFRIRRGDDRPRAKVSRCNPADRSRTRWCTTNVRGRITLRIIPN